MKIAVTRQAAISPEPYCTRYVPQETRVFDATATLVDVWDWAVGADPYVQWHQLVFSPVLSEGA